jgi:hypothetical protein
MHLPSITLFLISFLAIAQTSLAQNITDDTKIIRVLIFDHEEKGKKKIVNEGAFIKYRLNDSKKVQKGLLKEIQDGYMMVGDQKVAFGDCAMIAGKVYSQEQTLGGLSLGFGVSGLVITAIFVSFPPTAIIMGTTAIAATITGLILITKKKKFNLNKGWIVYGGSIQYNLMQ